MKPETVVMIIGPLSGYPEIDIDNMNRHFSYMLSGSGVDVISLWEHLKKVKRAINRLEPHVNNRLSETGWHSYAKMSFLNQALTCTNAVFLIPDMELCLAAKTALALAYGMGHELLEVEDGELVYSPLSEGDVNYQFSNPLAHMNDDETNMAIGNINAHTEDDNDEDDDNYCNVGGGFGPLVDEKGNPMESQESINRQSSPDRGLLNDIDGWLEEYWQRPK